MKTEQTPDLSKPDYLPLIFQGLAALLTISVSFAHVYSKGHYPLWYFITDLIILAAMGYNIQSYQNNLQKWREQSEQESKE